MKKSRYTETQIVKILKEVEGGRLVKESAENTAYQTQPITTGKPNTVVWKHLMLNV